MAGPKASQRTAAGLPRWKVALFSSVPLLVLLVCFELAAAVGYYQLHGERAFALMRVFDWATNRVAAIKTTTNLAAEVERSDQEMPVPFRTRIHTAYPGDPGILQYLTREYEGYFAELVRDAEQIGTRLIVMYIPSSPDSVHGDYFENLARRFDLGFVDARIVLYSLDWEDVSLMPWNGHLSRFGNRRVASQVAEALLAFGGERIGNASDERPVLIGDLAPSQQTVWNIAPETPYRVYTNKAGLRARHEIDLNDTRQRIVVLGDSFSFGPYLPNHDTWPEILSGMNEDWVVWNAGVSGYTIREQTALFFERAKYANPDITLLQVLDNDVYGMFYFKLNQFRRPGIGRRDPASEETAFLRRMEIAVDGAGRPIRSPSPGG